MCIQVCVVCVVLYCIVHNYVEIHYVVVRYICAHVYQLWKTVVVLVCVCACLNGLVTRTTYVHRTLQTGQSFLGLDSASLMDFD